MKQKNFPTQIMEAVYCSPTRPVRVWAQCRCGGHSPRRHFMVWRLLLFSSLTVSSWTSSYANTRPTGGFSYSCRSRVLSNIQKSRVMDQHMRANIWIPFYHLFPLETFSSEILGMKRTRYAMVQSRKISGWQSLLEKTETRVRRTGAPSQETV